MNNPEQSLWQRSAAYCDNHRLRVFFGLAVLLHLALYLCWPGGKRGSAQLSTPARVVHLMDLNVVDPSQVQEKVEVDERSLDVIKEQRIVQDVRQAGGVSEYFPYYSVDIQPRPLIEISSVMSYPPGARKMGIQATVVVELDISEEGMVDRIEIIRTAGWGFDEEVLRKLPKVRFRPARKQGMPVAVTVRIPIVFRLEE